MTKNVASFEKTSVGELIDTLDLLGFRLMNPHLNSFSGWDENGEEVALRTDSDARAFMIDGHGITIWRGYEDSLFLSVIQSIPRIYFSGCTDKEEQDLIEEFRKAKLVFSVDHEDFAFIG